MSWGKITRDAADDAFSEYIRRKAKKCVKCGRQGTGIKGITGLDASHFQGRGKESTRFDEENVDVLCRSCHRWFGEHKTEYEAWKLDRLGETKYNLLLMRANMTGKKDRESEKLYWRSKIRELDEEN